MRERPATWERVLGIVGGLGPHAHLEFERRLLAAVADAGRDQDYPPWLLSSIPATPDRTAAFSGRGPTPVPALVESLRRLEGHADFAVITCNSAHIFLDEVRQQVDLPILHLVEETIAAAARRRWHRVGLLATTGTLESGLYPRAARRIAPRLEIVSPLDLPEGARLQEELVMRPIYDGVKADREHHPETGQPYADLLRDAARCLAAAGAEGIITGCTEIPLALGRDSIEGTPLLDPMEVAAVEAIRIARGERPLPSADLP